MFSEEFAQPVKGVWGIEAYQRTLKNRSLTGGRALEQWFPTGFASEAIIDIRPQVATQQNTKMHAS